MRNNPKYGTKLEFESLFNDWSRVEKMRRFFTLRRQKLNKHFSQQPYHQAFTFELADTYIKTLDKFLMLEGKLYDNFKLDDFFEDPRGPLSWDRFYDTL